MIMRTIICSPRNLVFFLVFFAVTVSFGHDWPVHQEITKAAFQSSDALNVFLNDNGGNQSLTATPPQGEPSGTRSASDWLQQGSIFEDEEKYGSVAELRTPDHFYTLSPFRTPGQVFELYDVQPAVLDIRYLPENIVNSYIWAAQAGAPGLIYSKGVSPGLT